MAVIESGRPPDRERGGPAPISMPGPPNPGPPDTASGVRVEPLAALEWSEAIELAGGSRLALCPADSRRAWIHRAPESRVLALYRALGGTGRDLPAPWWLRALDRGLLCSRRTAFSVEDRAAKLLAARPGWVYVPWAGYGEDGYWEFVPSEHSAGPSGSGAPTTVLFTDRHPGWLDVLPAHQGEQAPEPHPLDGLAGLRGQLGHLENH